MSELLLGCGFARKKLLGLPGAPLEWKDLVTLDCNEACKPDVCCDLDQEGWFVSGSYPHLRSEFIEDAWCHVPADDTGYWALRFRENIFDEVHAYEVLEHLGRQGFVDTFFDTFINIHRILKPGGHLFATCPSRYSAWLWGDPSHRRVICAESLAFLSQEVIAQNRKNGTAMSDFSDLWDRDFKVLSAQDNHTNFIFCLQAIK